MGEWTAEVYFPYILYTATTLHIYSKGPHKQETFLYIPVQSFTCQTIIVPEVARIGLKISHRFSERRNAFRFDAV